MDLSCWWSILFPYLSFAYRVLPVVLIGRRQNLAPPDSPNHAPTLLPPAPLWIPKAKFFKAKFAKAKFAEAKFAKAKFAKAKFAKAKLTEANLLNSNLLKLHLLNPS